MSRLEVRPASPGGVRLTLPAGYQGRWLSDPADRARAESWISSSPERCLYNTSSYIDFARRQNGRADLLWLVRDGNPVLGLPLHPLGDSRITTGYSGAMFPAGANDGSLRRGVAALVALLGANQRSGFQVLQSAQAQAYDDRARTTTLAYLLDEHRLSGPSLYSRVLELEPLDGDGVPALGNELLLAHGLDPYEAELRSQIRQAIRNRVHVTCSLPSSDAELRAVYDEFMPLHTESWRRTGMTPHRAPYLNGLARSILDGGGRDMMVFARDVDGTPLAAVNCHLGADRALYWAGASSESGLRARANPLCLHAAIQACRQLGVRHFELGRFDARESSQKERTINRYKAQFGGELVRVGGFHTQPPITAIVMRRAFAPFARRRSGVRAPALDAAASGS